MKSSVKIIIVKIGNEYYGVETEWIKSIVRKSEIAKMPSKESSYMLGMINIHGHYMPVVDLHKKFHVSPISDCDNILAISCNDNSFAFSVDEIESVTDILQQDIYPLPQVLQFQEEQDIQSVIKANGKLILLLSIQQLMFEVVECHKNNVV